MNERLEGRAQLDEFRLTCVAECTQRNMPRGLSPFGSATGTDLAAMVFTIDKDAYDKYAALDQKAIYDAYSSKTPTNSDNANANAVSVGTTAAVGVTQYAAFIVTYTDKDWGEFYIAQVATIDGTKITSEGGSYSVSSIASGSSAGASNWQAVPEPTSAMLMLLGFAGLALRRRRA